MNSETETNETESLRKELEGAKELKRAAEALAASKKAKPKPCAPQFWGMETYNG